MNKMFCRHVLALMTMPLLLTLPMLLFAFRSRGQSTPPSSSPAPFPIGNWSGRLPNVQLIFHFNADVSGQVKGTMDSPQQGAMGIPIRTVTVTKDSVICLLTGLSAKYAAARTNDSTLTGTWYQGGVNVELDLHRLSASGAAAFGSSVRPQTPHLPFPYNSDSVEYDDADKTVHLAATLTFPKTGGPFPAAVLITGSGQQDRDETVFGHHPFAVIADYLTRRGYAVLRVDDRGTGLSKGEVVRATSADFALDVETSINWLKTQKQINASKIGLIGHSEGGMIAPMIASWDKRVAFVISLAGPSDAYATMMYQSAEGLRRANSSALFIGFAMTSERILLDNILAAHDTASFLRGADSAYRAYLATIPDSVRSKYMFMPSAEKYRAILRSQAESLMSPWFKFFLTYKAADYYPGVKCPVLALGGAEDIQVHNAVDLPVIDSIMKAAGNKKGTTRLMPGLNHFFQHCHTCMVAEYGKIEETFSPEVLQIMGDWLDKWMR